VDPAALNVTIPKMVFLPFVENASIHGIEPMKDGGKIDIDIKLDGNYLLFSVRDNGVGMASEQVERIYRYLGRKEELGERVGIHNVIHRLRMLYDDKFQLLIDSKQGEGTLVQITIPVEMDPKVPDALSMES
jgi:two-component system sensor histidine kinase YesM